MVGQAAEQIIAGVVLSERLAVTMYGAIHRAQFAGQRNLRGLVVDPKILVEEALRIALTDSAAVATAVALDHKNIVPTVAVESGGPDVVVVTRGVGRYVTVQDLIATARANRGQGGKLPIPVAAAIGRSVIEALAAAHQAKVVHGAVHPRSVLIDEDGGVRLGDFVVGRALTTAVTQGADAGLWRGLVGYLAPELAVGVQPTPAADVFAAGALMFTMLSGEAPPGNLHVTPAVERLVQRALDGDLARRYRSASDLLENLLEAFEDDRWEIADRGEVIRAAGLSRPDTNVDEATEDLLASLGSGPSALQAASITPVGSVRSSAERAAAQRTPLPHRLDALLADLDGGDHTAVEGRPFTRDPISELIARDPRGGEAIVSPRARVPSLDDPDDDDDYAPIPAAPGADRALAGRPRRHTGDEAAAVAALADLQEAAPVAVVPAPPLPVALPAVPAVPLPAVPLPAVPLIDAPQIHDLKPVRLKSRIPGAIALAVAIAGGIGIVVVYKDQEQATAAQKELRAQALKKHDEDQTRAINAQPDPGSLVVTSTPAEASVWLKLGRTNLDTMVLPSSQLHRVRLELEGYQPVDTEVVAASWEGMGATKKAKVSVTLKAAAIDRKTKQPVIEKLPALPPNLAAQTGFTPGEGPVHIETSPPGAEVWLLIGYANTGVRFPTIAGRAYELRVLAEGYRPGFAAITADEWREPTGDPRAPIDLAKKKPAIEKHVDLQVDPDAAKPKPRK